MTQDRLLHRGEEAPVEAFLSGRAEASLLMLSNIGRAGLAYRGEPYQGLYAARFVDGAVAGVAAHYWNGVLMLQAPDAMDELVGVLLQASDRGVTGLLGPFDQVSRAHRLLERAAAPDPAIYREDLMALDLADLKPPAALASGALRCRRPRSSELEMLASWRVIYEVEALGLIDDAALHARARHAVARLHEEGASWVLQGPSGALVATCNVIGETAGMVQIGGVWTRPAGRNRGYARAVVAGALLRARRAGRTRAVLITANPAAQRACGALGFRVTGAAGLVMFGAPRWLH